MKPPGLSSSINQKKILKGSTYFLQDRKINKVDGTGVFISIRRTPPLDDHLLETMPLNIIPR
jgi:hypothetical protein